MSPNLFPWRDSLLTCLLLVAALGSGCAGGGDDKGDEDDDGDGSSESGPDVVFLVDPSTSLVEAAGVMVAGLDDFADAAGPFVSAGVVRVALEEGEEGLLLDGVTSLDDGGEALLEEVACEGTCWFASEVVSDPEHTCGDPVGDVVSAEWLDCTCGVGAWEDACGAGTEEPLEAALMAMCRAKAADPGVCEDAASPFEEGWLGTNEGLLRGGPVHLVLMTDEGDGSRRLASGDEDAAVYGDAFDALAPDGWTLHLIGPTPDLSTCNSGTATTWGVERLDQLVERSGGLRADLYDGTVNCDPVDVGAWLTEVARSF